MDKVVQRVPAELMGANKDDVAADPQHRGGADDREPLQQNRHPLDQKSTEPLRSFGFSGGQRKSDVVHLHDEGHNAVHDDGDHERNDHHDDGALQETLVDDFLEGDDHDLGRENEVGADSSGNRGLFGLGTLHSHRHVVAVIVAL